MSNAQFPSIRALERAIRSTGHWVKVNQGLTYLASCREELRRFGSVEDLAVADAVDNDRRARALGHHLMVVRSALAQEMWSRQIFIGVSVLDDLVFHAASEEGDDDILLRIVHRIRHRRLGQLGLILYPVHSFGVLGAGLLGITDWMKLVVIDASLGFALTPQTNKITDTIAFLDQVRAAFGIKKGVRGHLIEHWMRSRAPWLERNPLLAVPVRNLPGYYVENQFFLVRKLQVALSLIAMLSTLQPRQDEGDRAARLFSTSMINNFQTLDIHHYIVLFDGSSSGTLDGQCIPMNLTPALLRR